MTEINVLTEDDTVMLTVEGHSGYASSGTDIVCAAISILTYSFAELCMELGSENKIAVERVNLDSGKADICVNDRYGVLIYPLQMLAAGLESVAEQYQDYVSLKWGRN